MKSDWLNEHNISAGNVEKNLCLLQQLHTILLAYLYLNKFIIEIKFHNYELEIMANNERDQKGG